MSFNFESMNNARQNTMCKGVNSRELGDIKNLKDFVGCVILCDGFFFSHSKKFNNDQVVIAGTVLAKDEAGHWQKVGQYLMNTPGRTYDEFQKIMESEEALEAVLRGELCLTDIQMVETKSGTTVIYKYRTGKPRYELRTEEDEDGYMECEEGDLPWEV